MVRLHVQGRSSGAERIYDSSVHFRGPCGLHIKRIVLIVVKLFHEEAYFRDDG